MKRFLKVTYRLAAWSIIYALACAVVAVFVFRDAAHSFLISWLATLWVLFPGYAAPGFMLALGTFMSYGATPLPPGSMSHSSSMFDNDPHGVNLLGEPTVNGISVISGAPMGMETSSFD